MLKDASGAVTNQLFYVRDPQGEDKFNGTFSDESDFSEFQLNQIPASYFTVGDGMFLISETEFLETYEYFEISRRINTTTNITSSIQAISPSILASHLFKVLPSVSGTHYLSLDTWYPRMY